MAEFEPNEEKLGDRTVRVEGPISEKLGNLWFYHKGKIIAAVLVLLAVILTVSQIVGRRKNNVMIAYAGPVYLSGDEQSALQDLLSAEIGAAMDDGNFLIGVTQYQVYSKEQIESIRAETHEDGEQKFVNSEFNSENYENFYTYVMTGDTAVLLLDPWLFHELRKNERLQPMSALFETIPPSTEETGFGILLSETGIYGESELLQKLPKDTVLCFLKPYVFGNTGNDRSYGEMQEVFRALVNGASVAE